MGRKSLGALLAPALAYAALAVVATFPLALRAPAAALPSADTQLNLWAVGWVAHQLPRQPLALFDGNVFHPHPRSLAFSEHLFVPALLAAPWIALTGNLVLGYNLALLLSLVLAGLGMYLFALELAGDRLAAFGAGLLYAFHTWNINELVRLQIVSNQWFPFLLLALLRFFRRPSLGRAIVCALTYALESLSCMYWALYLPLITGAAVIFLALRHRTRPRALLPLAASLLGALLISVPFAVPYLRNAAVYGFQRAEPEALPLSRYFDVLPGNLLYRDLLGTARSNVGAAHFLGFVALALAAVGALRRGGPETGRSSRPLLVGLAIAGFLLSLGPPGPYALLYAWVPGFRNVRYPERFALVLVLGLAPLVALGLERVRAWAGRFAVVTLLAALFLEHLSAPLELAPLPSAASAPEVYRWAAREPGGRVLAEVPIAHHWMRRSDALAMYYSTVHWKPTVQGFTGFFPPDHNFIRWRLFHFPDPESLADLRRLGVDTVIVRPEDGAVPRWAWSRDDWTVVGPFPEGHLALRLRDQPPPAGPPPPPAEDALREVERAGWKVKASASSERLAIDGDPVTLWTTGEPQQSGDFYTLRFPRPVTLARVSLELGYACEFPMHLRLRGETAEGGPVEVPFDERAAYQRFFVRLLERPRERRLDIDLPRPRLVKLVLEVAENDAYGMPWAVAELRVFEPR